MSSLVSKATGDSIVSNLGALLEEFDPFPFLSVKDGNLLEINPQKNAEIRYIGPATIDDAKYNDCVFIASRHWRKFTKRSIETLMLS